MNGEQIKKLRTDADLTQQDLADLLHVTKKTVGEWERGGEVSRVNELAIKKVIQDLIDLRFADC